MRLILLILLCLPLSFFAYGQACPACSNPALQSSEKLGMGFDSLASGTIQVALNITNGFNYKGGHPNKKGLTASGDVITVPLHQHVVDLDFLRTELNLEYTLATNKSIWLRIPYDIKAQESSIVFTEPVTEAEREAIIRNRDIHHRNETYSGFSDIKLFFSKRYNNLFSGEGRLDLAIGSSIPTGKTEEDPLAAGAEGKEHLHILFGTGTFDPLFEFHYNSLISDKLLLGIFSINRISLYENQFGNQGPFETTSGISIGYLIHKDITLQSTLANFSQTQAEWNDVKDPNSGLISYNATFSSTIKIKSFSISPGYRIPVYQRTLSGEGDVFEYGPTFTLSLYSKF